MLKQFVGQLDKETNGGTTIANKTYHIRGPYSNGTRHSYVAML